MKVYDVIIIGGGPAGLSAGIYAGRAMLNGIIIEKGQEGGQIVQTSEIENYPGSITAETGLSLIERMVEQVKQFGIGRVFDSVKEMDLTGQIKRVICERETYEARSVILAGGAAPSPIGCPGEEEFLGRGISRCATCDGPFFRDLEVFVIGGGNAALEEALFLTKFAKKVTIVHRRKGLRADKTIQERVFNNEKIEFMYDTVVKSIHGDGIIDTMLLENVKDGSITEFKANPEDGTFGIFVFIGNKPETELLQGQIELSEKGYIITDDNMKTNIPGVFAAGDIREKSLRQVVTAAADGAIAAVQAEKYLEEQKGQ